MLLLFVVNNLLDIYYFLCLVIIFGSHIAIYFYQCYYLFNNYACFQQLNEGDERYAFF